MDRKTFFGEAFKSFISGVLDVVGDNAIIKALEDSAKPKIRPPGNATPDAEFQKLCTGCDACMIACPFNVIMIEDLNTRLPLIYPETNPCLHCSGYPCIKACNTGALSLKNHKSLKLN